MVRVLVDTCRRTGMAPFVSLRLNDVHLQEFYGEKDPRSSVVCRFYEEHPDYLFDPDHKTKYPAGYCGYRGMNWAIPAVREYKLGLLTELAESYALAGLELDFLRDNRMFRLNETTEAQRVDAITDFVGRVRAALDRNTPAGERRWLCVRIPLELAAHGDIGLDVERLHAAGVDMFNLSGWYQTTQTTDVGRVRAKLPEAALYVEMTHSAGSHTYFLPSGNYGTNGNPRTGDYQFYTAAYLAQRRGADGMSLFNFVYYRMGLEDDIPVMEPPFHVLEKLNDLDWLAKQHQHYMLGADVYHSQMPRTIEPGTTESFVFGNYSGLFLTGFTGSTGFRQGKAQEVGAEVAHCVETATKCRRPERRGCRRRGG